jgi:hypothetical protein
LVADAQAEVHQGRKANEEADDSIEALQGDDGKEAEAAAVRDRVAEERGERGEERVHLKDGLAALLKGKLKLKDGKGNGRRSVGPAARKARGKRR